MVGRKQETRGAKVIAAVAALKIMPIKKMLIGIAAVAGTAYAISRLRSADRSQPSET
jgi:hypothetical protein